MSVKLLTEHHLEFLSLKGGFTGLSESILVKMPHCWKSHVAAQMFTQMRFCVYGNYAPACDTKKDARRHAIYTTMNDTSKLSTSLFLGEIIDSLKDT